MSDLQRLEDLLDLHERAASALRTSLALLKAADAPAVAETHQARTRRSAGRRLLKDLARRVVVRRKKKPAKKKPAPRTATMRRASAALLQRFHHEHPTPLAVLPRQKRRRVAVFIRHGYLAKSGDGYIRTDKPFAVIPASNGTATAP